MKPAESPEIRETAEATHYLPAVSIIMPFEPKMSLKADLIRSLKIACDKVERELVDNYPKDISILMMQKLNAITKEVNFHTFKNSIAIYVSPVFEKILYLDIKVEEKIIVDESFEIRDLVYCKKQVRKYLLLQLNSKEIRIYLGNSNELVRIVSNSAPSIQAYMNDVREKIPNITDPATRKEIMLDKFLHQVDNSLDIVLNAWHLPVFVMGTEKILSHFKNITRHSSAVIEYLPGNYEASTMGELNEMLGPFISDWKNVHRKDLLNQLEEAAGKKKLATGMRDVWREATAFKGRLLVVEKNYMYAAKQGSAEEIIYKAVEPYNKFSYIKDAVDDVIEKVLENGGDVEFVEEGVLLDYHHIALIQ